MRITIFLIAFTGLLTCNPTFAQDKADSFETTFSSLKWRNIGPFRGGRSVASSGVVGQPGVFYMGSTGGGVWKSTDYGQNWKNCSDGTCLEKAIGTILPILEVHGLRPELEELFRWLFQDRYRRSHRCL